VARYVWIDSWQMQCCGDEFSVGSMVTWSATPVTDRSWFESFLEQDTAALITHHGEHHSDFVGMVEVQGLVRSIRAVYCRYSVKDRVSHPVARSATVERRESADGWEEEDEFGKGRVFVGYLVKVDRHVRW
jgi:hypothetical protein